MDKILDATFDGEVFRPDEPIDLASNTKVKIIIEDNAGEKKNGTGERYAFLRYARSVSIDAPPDYASNIDEYLYGGKSLDDE